MLKQAIKFSILKKLFFKLCYVRTLALGLLHQTLASPLCLAAELFSILFGTIIIQHRDIFHKKKIMAGEKVN